MAAPNVFVIFADDLRYEVGNKTSYLGVYQGEMVFPAGANITPKLVISAFIQWHEDSPPDGWALRIDLPGGQVGGPFPLPPTETLLVPDPDTRLITFNLQTALIPFALVDKARIGVELFRRRQRKLVAVLRMRVLDHSEGS